MPKKGKRMVKEWARYTRDELASFAKQKGLVIVTIGATEQHGPHLSVEVDNQIVRGIARQSIAKINGVTPVIMGPHIPFGYSYHHFLYAGAISLSLPTLQRVIEEVLISVANSGFKKIFLLNGHGGNEEVIHIAVKSLHETHPELSLAAASYWMLSPSLKAYREKTTLYDVGHAGQFETALMLALNPKHVHMAALEKNKKERLTDELLFPTFTQFKANAKSIWEKIDGYSDQPHTATQKLGIQILELITDDISQVFKDFSS